jgi:transcriptional regulator with XRE-family HTH domain
MAVCMPTPVELARRAQGLTQRQLCERSEVDRSSISRAEAGMRPSWNVRAKLAAALGRTVDELWPPSLDEKSAPAVIQGARMEVARARQRSG